ncbi:hypothetical protein OBBRIDRAFT_815708 [Obba rivulosa]|uniref:CxC2-like cysteine cluster KDZ transposase-associated domain-containing protein n=1 Tax=Obba rivulosa TaxID=1052685 RepID=A0A8E2AHZ9_9APHY|nr:hypothetical protein OBBRIDRAFT_815708 [Obba rivulosa]
MTIVHEHGVDSVRFHFCGCITTTGQMMESEAIQFLSCDLFPRSWKEPRTVFTLGVLRQFHLLSMQANVNGHDFYAYLQRTTDNVRADHVLDRYREFLTGMWEFAFLRTVKRAGCEPGRNIGSGALAVWCPACPQPDKNMDPNWSDRPIHEQFLDALFHTIDSNFHQNMKDKSSDPDDFPLTCGAAYFADENDFKVFQTYIGPLKPEPSTCNKFEAMGYGTYRGKVSGTVGVICARHMFVLPGGGVDLQKGERFTNVDFALLLALQPWMGLHIHVAGYDIACMCTIRKTLFPWTLPAIGKFHLPAHIPSCCYKFSYHYLPGVGITDGEAPERIWPAINALATRTREMSAGHRHDVINDYHSDHNVRRTHGLARKLSKKYEEALEQKVSAQEWCSILVPVLTVKEASLEMLRLHGPQQPGLVGLIEEGIEIEELQYVHPLRAVTSGIDYKSIDDTSKDMQDRKTAYQTRLETWALRYESVLGNALREAVDAVAANHISMGYDDTFLYAMMLENEETVLEQVHLSDLEESEVESGSETLDAMVGEKRKSTKEHGLGAEVTTSRVELPSKYAAPILRHSTLKAAVDVERQLCESQAGNMLRELRTELILKYSLLKAKAQGSGVTAHTRTNVRIHRKQKTIDRAAWRYRHARRALLALGMDANDRRFHELMDEDKRAFVMDTNDERLGDSRKAPSWIWEDITFVETDETEKGLPDAMRVHWFRQCTTANRWKEQVLLLEVEMRRTCRFFRHYQQRWLDNAHEHEARSNARRAAYARRQAFRYTRLLEGCKERFPAKCFVA